MSSRAELARRVLENLGQGGLVTTISFRPDVYKGLDEIARQNKVSLAWVVREASEKYVAVTRPLVAKRIRTMLDSLRRLGEE
jgi:predicted DNA-binding ribbon-helix-helix protein